MNTPRPAAVAMATAAAVVVLSGCSDDTGSDARRASADSDYYVMEVGDTLHGRLVDSTVKSIAPAVPGPDVDMADKGEHLVIDVEQCITGEPRKPIESDPWDFSAVTVDGQAVDPSLAFGTEFKNDQPELATRGFSTGCNAGKILYTVPAGVEVDKIVFSYYGTEFAEWRVKTGENR